MRQRIIISESEKRSILGLHESLNKRPYGLLTEATQEDVTSFFASQKSKFKNFPDGKVISYKNGDFEFGYEVVNADGTKYILIPNGKAVVDNGTGYKEQPNYNWTKVPFMDKLAIKPLQSIPLSTVQSTEIKPLQAQVVGGGGNVTDISGGDLRKLDRSQKRTERKTEKEIQDRKKEIVNQCTKVYNTYLKQMGKNPEFWSKPENSSLKSKYDNFFKKVEDLGGSKIGCKDVDLNWDAIGIKFV